jgi:hypothetical protein
MRPCRNSFVGLAKCAALKGIMIDIARRREAVHRIQVGLAGLAGVLLLVGLANIVAANIKSDDRAATMAVTGDALNSQAGGDGIGDNEPLAELGVAPSEDSLSQPITVPDLQPDPRLRKRMDRDPAAQR